MNPYDEMSVEYIVCYIVNGKLVVLNEEFDRLEIVEPTKAA